MTNIFMAGRKLFIDTGAFIALTVQKDQYHQKATAIFRAVSKKRVIPVTTNLIIGETYSFLRYRVNFPTAINFLDKIKDAERMRKILVIYATAEIEQEVSRFLRKYSDQDISYVDAVSFVILEQNPEIKDVFAFNGHFHLLKQNILQ